MTDNAHEARDVQGKARQRVLVGEPDPLARQAISQGFSDAPGFIVIAATGDARELSELARHYQPDISLIHAGAREFDGLDVCRQIVAVDPEARVLILERNPSAEREISALLAGASGVTPKAAGIQGIIAASQAILDGQLPHTDESMRLVLQRLRKQPKTGIGMRPVRSPLTPREWEVLDLLTAERTSAQIADELHLSKDTVASHIKNLMRKLKVHSRSAAVSRGQTLRSPEGGFEKLRTTEQLATFNRRR